MAGSKSKYDALLNVIEDEDLPSFTSNGSTTTNNNVNPTTSAPSQQLDFQDFSRPFSSPTVSGKLLQPTASSTTPATTNSTTTSSSSSSSFPPNFVPPSQLQTLPQLQQQQALPVYRDPANAKFWHVEYYSKYFDVDTKDVLDRLRWSLYPNSHFLTALAIHKDLYGPFWVPTTLIFALFVSSSLANSVVSYLNNTIYRPDITRLSTAASTVYIYTLLLPLFIWILGKYLSKPMEMIQIIGIFGYSQTLWVPVTLLCIIPLELVRWILVGVTFFITGAFVIRNLHSLLTTASPNSPVPVQGTPLNITMALTLCAHVTFALLLKILFFSYTLVSAPPKT